MQEERRRKERKREIERKKQEEGREGRNAANPIAAGIFLFSPNSFEHKCFISNACLALLVPFSSEELSRTAISLSSGIHLHLAFTAPCFSSYLLYLQ